MFNAWNGLFYSEESFIINANAAKEFKKNNNFGNELINELNVNLNSIQEKTNLQIGIQKNLILISEIRLNDINAKILDTILNVGLNQEIVKILAKNNNGFFAYDTWRRFIQMYSHVVHRVDTYDFDEILENYLLGANLSAVSQLDAEDLEDI